MSVFVVIGASGLGVLLVSLLLGEVFDGLFDAVPGDVLSTSVVAGFLAAFGFAGALAVRSLGTGPAVVVGCGAGALVGGVAGWLTRTLTRTQTAQTPSGAALVGLPGTVVTQVPSQGYGEVSLTVAGHLTKLNARADEVLLVGTPITVTATLSPTSVMVVRRA